MSSGPKQGDLGRLVRKYLVSSFFFAMAAPSAPVSAVSPSSIRPKSIVCSCQGVCVSVGVERKSRSSILEILGLSGGFVRCWSWA
jgi:hypothetical protein